MQYGKNEKNTEKQTNNKKNSESIIEKNETIIFRNC